jgi:hypothetical protein
MADKPKLQYAAVKWGSNLRWSGEKVTTPDQACRLCYGMVDSKMVVYGLGGNKQKALKVFKELWEKHNLSVK